MTDKNIIDYDSIDYSSYWQSPERSALDRLERRLLPSLLPRPPIPWAVDLGGGFGRLTPYYLSLAENVVLVDYSEKLLQQAQRQFAEGPKQPLYVQADIKNLPFRKNLFALVAIVRVLHHFADIAPPFREIERILRPQGTLLFTYYNKRKLSSLLRFLLGKEKGNPLSVGHSPAPGDEHLFFTHPAYIRQLLNDNALKLQLEKNLGLLFELTGRLGLYPVLLERALALLPSPLKLSNYSYCRALPEKKEQGALPSPAATQDIFVCPACKEEGLIFEGEKITCPPCQKEFSFKNNIYDFRV